MEESVRARDKYDQEDSADVKEDVESEETKAGERTSVVIKMRRYFEEKLHDDMELIESEKEDKDIEDVSDDANAMKTATSNTKIFEDEQTLENELDENDKDAPDAQNTEHDTQKENTDIENSVVDEDLEDCENVLEIKDNESNFSMDLENDEEKEEFAESSSILSRKPSKVNRLSRYFESLSYAEKVDVNEEGSQKNAEADDNEINLDRQDTEEELDALDDEGASVVKQTTNGYCEKLNDEDQINTDIAEQIIEGDLRNDSDFEETAEKSSDTEEDKLDVKFKGQEHSSGSYDNESENELAVEKCEATKENSNEDQHADVDAERPSDFDESAQIEDDKSSDKENSTLTDEEIQDDLIQDNVTVKEGEIEKPLENFNSSEGEKTQTDQVASLNVISSEEDTDFSDEEDEVNANLIVDVDEPPNEDITGDEIEVLTIVSSQVEDFPHEDELSDESSSFSDDDAPVAAMSVESDDLNNDDNEITFRSTAATKQDPSVQGDFVLEDESDFNIGEPDGELLLLDLENKVEEPSFKENIPLYRRSAPPPPIIHTFETTQDHEDRDETGDEDASINYKETEESPADLDIMPVFRMRSSSDSVLTTGSISERISSLQQQTEPPPGHATLTRNKSALHSGQSCLGGSMTSLTSAPPTPTPASSLSTSDLSERPRVSHGKPNLAPKPPTLAAAPTVDTRPSPPPKKLIVNGKIASRTQSMRVPRSPPVSPPSPQSGLSRPLHLPPAPINPHIGTKNNASHFGTLRAPRGLRPPGVCPPPPPGAPPPPPARHASLAAPPPPPPHHNRQHSNISNGEEANAPAPPVRGSSMRSLDLEARYGDLFNPLAMFPLPDPFLRIAKGYSSTTVSAKAQAPPPPLKVPIEGWSGTSSAC